MRKSTAQLGAWFLGPKAENADVEEGLFLHILRDYYHWRRNYYPADEITITQQMRRESLDWNDALAQQLGEILGALKRHFPAYSPRYVAHMMSDQTIPSVLGYFAGMLYNPNNVTPEAAPVTVQWELEAGADILRMLGYEVAPPPDAAHRETRKEFGWAHITGGGTLANLESLWVARNVRYLPLAIKRACTSSGIELRVKLPGTAAAVSLASLQDRDCLALKPNEATFLLPRFTLALKHQFALTDEEAGSMTWKLLGDTGCGLSSHGAQAGFPTWPPAIFVAGTAHYSIAKVADVLGIGRENVVLVDVDRYYRLDVRDLEQKVRGAIAGGRYPLAVIATAGTTEEGSVDPVDRIIEFREQMEQDEHCSFWLHVDAAWGGYMRTIFVPEAEDPEETIQQARDLVQRELQIDHGAYRRNVHLRWGNRDVCRAFLSLARAESITVDPHKMGFVPYPCGVVAFRNDRIRHFLTQDTPYITIAASPAVPGEPYQPPSTIGPFVLEGSKPGAAAASCWFSHRMIPPDRTGYGEIVRASLLAARELYERIVHWDDSCRANKIEPDYRFIPIADSAPDTNIVCFVIKKKDDASLENMNILGEAVFRRLTIEPELGQRHYSYSQPFFLSHTRFRSPHYSRESVADLLSRANVDAGCYERTGIFVIRATVMNPYIVLSAETGRKQELLAELVNMLGEFTAECLEASRAGP